MVEDAGTEVVGFNVICKAKNRACVLLRNQIRIAVEGATIYDLYRAKKELDRVRATYRVGIK